MSKSFCLFLALVIFAFALPSEAAPTDEESPAKQQTGGNNNKKNVLYFNRVPYFL